MKTAIKSIMSKDEKKEGQANSNDQASQRTGIFSMFSQMGGGASNIGGNDAATGHSSGDGAGFFSTGTFGNWFTSNKPNITTKEMNAIAPISF